MKWLLIIAFTLIACSPGRQETVYKVVCSYGPFESKSIQITEDIGIVSGDVGEDRRYLNHFIFENPNLKDFSQQIKKLKLLEFKDSAKYRPEIDQNWYCLKLYYGNEGGIKKIKGVNFSKEMKSFLNDLFASSDGKDKRIKKGHYNFETFDCITPPLIDPIVIDELSNPQ